MRHKPLLECLSPGSCLRRSSDDRDWKTDRLRGEKLKSSMLSSLTIYNYTIYNYTSYKDFVIFSGHALVLCLSNPETINTFK